MPIILMPNFQRKKNSNFFGTNSQEIIKIYGHLLYIYITIYSYYFTPLRIIYHHKGQAVVESPDHTHAPKAQSNQTHLLRWKKVGKKEIIK